MLGWLLGAPLGLVGLWLTYEAITGLQVQRELSFKLAGLMIAGTLLLLMGFLACRSIRIAVWLLTIGASIPGVVELLLLGRGPLDSPLVVVLVVASSFSPLTLLSTSYFLRYRRRVL
ncbi:MAG: hypothetical protein QM784_30330 [Polyangiaceae bacterium]